MFETVFLGTSASAPSIHRNLPALLVKYEDFRFLVDCGEGTQRQILQSGIGFKNLTRILITHGHLDHILGLAGLLSTFMRWEAIQEMEIFAGQYTLERIHDLLFSVVLRGTASPMPIRLVPLSDGQFFETEDFSIRSFPVVHRGSDSFGFCFCEKGRRPFLPERAEALNIPPGPWRRDLVEGKTALLPDGRQIQPEDVLGEYKPGTRLVIIGDSGETNGLEKICQDADALIIEATYLDSEADMARRFSHLTARQAAELAKHAGVRQLILTHVSRRYREKDILREAQSIFPNTDVARDFSQFQIKRD